VLRSRLSAPGRAEGHQPGFRCGGHHKNLPSLRRKRLPADLLPPQRYPDFIRRCRALENFCRSRFSSPLQHKSGAASRGKRRPRAASGSHDCRATCQLASDERAMILRNRPDTASLPSAWPTPNRERVAARPPSRRSATVSRSKITSAACWPRARKKPTQPAQAARLLRVTDTLRYKMKKFNLR